MTSELRVDNLKGSTTGGSINVLGEGTSATTNLQQGLVKAWCNYDGDNNSISDNFNIGSITDVNTGIHQFGFTNVMSNVNYSCAGNAGNSGFHNCTTKSNAGGTQGASSVVIRVSQTDNSDNDDDAQTSFQVAGDLA
jgi:hypothetical protein